MTPESASEARHFRLHYYVRNKPLARLVEPFMGTTEGARMEAASTLAADRLESLSEGLTRAEVHEVLPNGTLASRGIVRVRVTIKVPEDARCT